MLAVRAAAPRRCHDVRATAGRVQIRAHRPEVLLSTYLASTRLGMHERWHRAPRARPGVLMRVQHSRTDSLPLTWEVPTAITAAWLLLAVLGLPAGQGLAWVLSGSGFTWPHGTLVTSVGGLTTGHPGRGLPRPVVAELPPDLLIYSSIAMVEVVLAVAVVWGMLVWWRSVGPGAQPGIAGRREVERVLGPGSLRRRRSTIRPDLLPPSRRRRLRRLTG
jgi:hypothetical protein